MGVYYRCACHDCQEVYAQSSLKIREILLNPQAAAQVGRFLALHNRHHVELVPDNDERTMAKLEGYERVGDKRILQECQ